MIKRYKVNPTDMHEKDHFEFYLCDDVDKQLAAQQQEIENLLIENRKAYDGIISSENELQEIINEQQQKIERLNNHISHFKSMLAKILDREADLRGPEFRNLINEALNNE